MTSSKRYLLISSMKNEASFILEWVAYHRLIGFTDILVYTNDCEDGTVEMLTRLQELGLANHEPNKVLRRGPHKSALKAAREHPLVAAADWILVSDIDEFLVVKTGDGSVRALIDHVPDDTDVIPVTWRLFSHAGRTEFLDVPVIEQFTDAEWPLEDGGQPDRFVKSLFRKQQSVERFGIHGPKTSEDYIWRQPDGRLLTHKDNRTRPERAFAYDVAQINHYAVGSIDGYLVKKDRGRANHWRQDLGADYWKRLCRGGEEDRDILVHRNRVVAEVARMRADPVLNRLHEEAVAWRKDRIAQLCQVEAFAKMREELIKLTKLGFHQRKSGEMKSEVTDIHSRLQTMCRDMRQLMDQLSPHETAELAHESLDNIEKGLFGKVTSG